jgi:hypothetical protein
MLGRKTYTQDELDHARAAIAAQLAAYDRLAEAVAATGDPDAKEALDAFEPLFANAMTLALDRWFVHRVRAVSGKDGNPLNEVELLSESLMGDGGVLHANNVIKLVPAESVLGLGIGEPIRLSAPQLARLAEAYLAELDARFVAGAS